MNRFKKALHVLSWVPIFLLFTFPLLLLVPLAPWVDWPWWYYCLPVGLIFIGMVVAVPLALVFSEGDLEKWPDVFWLWGNDEEGCPQWWLDNCANGEENKVAEWFPRWWWFAVRNPVNNHRYLFKDRPASIESNWPEIATSGFEADSLHKIGQQSAYVWRWNGPFAGYRKIWLNKDGRYTEIWGGWKLGSKIPGLGFTFQFRPRRKIGT